MPLNVRIANADEERDPRLVRSGHRRQYVNGRSVRQDRVVVAWCRAIGSLPWPASLRTCTKRIARDVLVATCRDRALDGVRTRVRQDESGARRYSNADAARAENRLRGSTSANRRTESFRWGLTPRRESPRFLSFLLVLLVGLVFLRRCHPRSKRNRCYARWTFQQIVPLYFSPMRSAAIAAARCVFSQLNSERPK